MLFLGIDPGATGAISVFDEATLVRVEPMPETTHDLVSLFERCLDQSPCVALIEEITGPAISRMKGPGLQSTWKFGWNCGLVNGVLAGVRMPYESILAVRWQRLMNCRKKDGKKVSKALAQQLFPQAKINESCADAVIIGELCRRLKTGQTVPGA